MTKSRRLEQALAAGSSGLTIGDVGLTVVVTPCTPEVAVGVDVLVVVVVVVSAAVTVATLLARFGSCTDEATVAVSATEDPLAGTPAMVAVGVDVKAAVAPRTPGSPAPGARSPSEQVTVVVPEHSPSSA